MLPIRRVALDRRTFLRGASAGLMLPWLDAMRPALGGPPAPKPRAMFVFSPNGMHMDNWRPTGEGRGAKLHDTLEPLQPWRKRLTVFSGLDIDGGRAHGDGPGDHARAAASFLTCAHPRKTGGADIQAGVSIDQLIAQRRGGEQAFASLEVGMERGPAAGICDSGYSCAYSSNISWSAPDRPVVKETSPRAVFARLFGDPEQALDREAAQRQRDWDRSVLDLVHADAKSLRKKLGAADRNKLEQYLESVRALEQRLAKAPTDEPTTPVPDGLLDGSGRYPESLAMMYELLALALATDRTRVVTFMLGNAGSNRSYRWIDVPGGHHTLSHHGGDEKKLAQIARINRFQVEQFAAFVERLATQQEGDGDLLSQCLVAFGSGIGDGNRHNHHDLPMLLCGEGGGAAKGMGHVVVDKKTPMANLYVSIAAAMNCPVDAFADSTGALPIR